MPSRRLFGALHSVPLLVRENIKDTSFDQLQLRVYLPPEPSAHVLDLVADEVAGE
jgi:hypothetical protein